MSPLERAKSLAHAQLDEIKATADVWRSYHEFLVPMSRSLFGHFTSDPERSMLQNALKGKDVDSSALYRGLVVQVHGVFEGFVKSLASAILDNKKQEVQCYEELSERIRTEHVVFTSKVLSLMKSGTVHGVKFDFNVAIKNLGLCLSGADEFHLNKEAFTILMGNCTPNRLEELFKSLDVDPPFGDKLGLCRSLKDWSGDSSKRRVAKAARKYLDNRIEQRNDIVHGNVSKTLTQADFEETVVFFFALIDGMCYVAGSDG